MAKLKKWVIYFSISILLGCVLGYVFVWLWFLFSVFLLGYGDSGPPWVNLISDLVFFIGLGVAIIGGQILFFTYWGKKRRMGRRGRS